MTTFCNFKSAGGLRARLQSNLTVPASVCLWPNFPARYTMFLVQFIQMFISFEPLVRFLNFKMPNNLEFYKEFLAGVHSDLKSLRAMLARSIGLLRSG